jgi:hypothetical protein
LPLRPYQAICNDRQGERGLQRSIMRAKARAPQAQRLRMPIDPLILQ